AGRRGNVCHHRQSKRNLRRRRAWAIFRLPGGSGVAASVAPGGGEDPLIRGYLRRTALWKRMVSEDGYPPQPAPGTPIPVRWEARRRLVRSPEGQEVVSEARVFCVDPVQPGDVLEYGGRDWPVITVSETPGLDGKAMF